MRGRTPSAVQGRDRQTGGKPPPVPAEVAIRDRRKAINPGGWGRAPCEKKFEAPLVFQFLASAGMRSGQRI